MNLQELLNERKTAIEEFVISHFSKEHNPRLKDLQDPMAASLGGGKKIRGFLVIEGAALMGLSPLEAMPTAAAIEAFHAYSLVHDDLPAMDDAAERRGQPTVHVQYDEATAVLVGDSLIPLGFRWISEEQSQFVSPAQIIEVIKLFSHILGTDFLTGGQHLDLKGAKNKKEHWDVMRRKTSGLIQGGLLAGALLGGMDSDRLDTLSGFGERLGLAYQLVDDLLDWDEDGYPEIMGQEEVRQNARDMTQQALKLLEKLGGNTDNLRELTLYLAERTS